jgi:hypothetical protein
MRRAVFPWAIVPAIIVPAPGSVTLDGPFRIPYHAVKRTIKVQVLTAFAKYNIFGH